MIRFIDEHQGSVSGSRLICRVYCARQCSGFLTARGYAPPSKARRTLPRAQLKDELLVPEVARLHAENYGVYGVRKMHALMRRQGWQVGRDQTERG
jgi:putative transposase